MNIIKRITAVVISLSLSLTYLPSAAVFAATDIREDFEGVTHNFKLITSANSTYEYWNTDTSAKNNNNTQIYGIGSGTGDTGAYWTLTEAISDTVRFSTDIRLDACASGKASAFALLGSHCSKNYLSSNQRILTISGAASGKGVWGSLMLNSINITDKANIPSANGSESGGKGGIYGDSTGWLRLSATLNFTLQKASVKLTRISDGSVIYEGMQDFIDNTSSLQEIFIAANKTCGGVFLDNISIGKPELIDNPQIAGASVNMISSMEINSESAVEVSRIYDSGGNDISDTAQISYSTSDYNIISINENGVMKKNAEGAADITVTINSEGSEPYIYTQTVSDIKSVISEASDNETVIDTSTLPKGGSVKEFTVITSFNGKAVRQYTEECANSITVDTNGADKAEVIPVFYCDSIKGAKNSVTLTDYFPNGRYSFTVKKAAAKCCDIYVNDCMIANNVDQPGYGRNRSSGAEYTARDTRIEGGSVKIQTKDIIESGDNGELSWVKIQREPETVTRKKRVTIIGDSLVANYYGSGSEVLGSKQTGWGQALSDFINVGYEVINLANSGYYAKNMYDTSFPSALYNSEPGDMLLFEAGYNDEKYSSREEMKEYVLKMIEEAQAKGIEIVLVSPDACVEAYTYPVKLGSVMKEAAEEKNIGFIDISLYSYNFLKHTYGDDTDAIKKTIGLKYGIGKDDNTHSSYTGAYKYASFVAGGLYKLGYTDMINTEYTYSQTDFKGNKIECNALTEAPEYDGSEKPSPSDTPSVTPNPLAEKTVFVFGNNVLAGQTEIKITDIKYSDITGYGFDEVSDVTVNNESVTSSSAYRFKMKADNADYTVKVTTTADNVICEKIDTVPADAKIEKDASKCFETAVCDGVLDITIPSGKELSKIEITKKPDEEKRTKPAVFAVGDSTTTNTEDGAMSWGDCIEQGKVTLPDNISKFYNCGIHGYDSVTYYNIGQMEYVLLNICPGDYVVINMGINSRAKNESGSFTAMIRDYYVKAVKQRGGIPVLRAHTAFGPVGDDYSGGYDSVSRTFNCSRSDANRVKTLRNIAKAENTPFIETGIWMNDYFNSLTYDEVSAAGFNSSIELVQSWYLDYNHYLEPLGVVVANYLLGEVSQMIKDSIPKEKITVLEKTYSGDTLSCKTNITKDGRLIFAAYEKNGVLCNVKVQDLDAGDHNVSLVCSDKANRIKLMLWEGDNMKPIADAEEFYLSQAMAPHELTPVRAMAVSEQNNGEGYYPASNAIDGITEGKADGSSYESRWTAAAYNVPAWITVDYGSIKELTQLDIWWNTSEGKTNRYSGYEIYVSDDNMNYKKVIDKNGNTTSLHTADTLPEGTEGRFVKVNITKLSAGWPVVFEIKAQGRNIDTGADMSRLQTALSFCKSVDLNAYQDYGASEYQAALSVAKTVDDNSSQEDINNAANSLIAAKENLRLKERKDGERTVVNENPDWIFVKEKNAPLNAADISSKTTVDIDLTGFTAASLPHTWNARDGFDGSGSYDRCKGWYRKNIYIDKSYEGKRIYLIFGGSGMSTELYINGIHIPYGEDVYGNGNSSEYAHKGGYSAFKFDITDYVNYGEQNLAAVMCDNTKTAEIAPLDGDFNNQGGLYRDVELVVCESVHIADDYGADAVYITPEKVTDVNDNTNTDFNLTAAAEIANDSAEDKEITISAVLRHPDSFDVPDNDYIKQYLRFNPEDMYVKGGRDVKAFESKTVTVKSGESYNYTDTVLVESPHLWNGLDDPYQYEVAVTVSVDDKITEEIVKNIGFRYIDIPRPNSDYTGGGFYLNGKPYVLRGANKHQDYGRGENALGFAVTEKERLNDAGIMYELGMNAVRLAHYQHDEKEIELYDKLGIIVWSELGLVDDMISQSAQSYNAFMNVTKYQMTSMVKQLYNHPSIAVWGISNELRREEDDNLKAISSTEMSVPSGTELFEQLNNTVKAIDTIRPTTYAAFSLFGRETDWDSDTFAMNLYPYWYTSHAKQLHGGAASMTDQMHRYFGVPDKNGKLKPMGISEYGASGVIGYTAQYQPDGTVKHPGEASYTTTYQAYCHEKVYNEIVNELPYVWCSFVWQLFDNASFKKGSLLKGTNDKGLVRYDHETKKDAFYFYKANWNDFEPFAHIVESDTKSIVRAYSNADKLQLYVDGKQFGNPITDTDTSDGVADGLGVFMWYDVPDGEINVEIVD